MAGLWCGGLSFDFRESELSYCVGEAVVLAAH